jgi:lipoprotein signal peptidase
MTSRRLVLTCTAAVLLVPDLVQKAVAPHYGHTRSPGYAVLALALLTAVVALVPRVPSRALAAAAGVAAAGAAGNLVGALAFSEGVPNPILAGGVAFNLADVYAVAGATALVVGAVLYAARHPELLHEPV